MTPNDSTLVFNWEMPDSPNGDILNYTIRIIRLSDDALIVDDNATTTAFTATNLGNN